MTDVVRYGGCLYINEGNFLRDSVASDMYGLLDKRRKLELLDKDGEVIYAPDNMIVIMDFNAGAGYTGTRDLNAAFRNRFAVQMPFEYDDEIEKKLIKAEAIRVMGQQFRQQVAAGMFEIPVSTNMLVEFEACAQAYDLPFAIRNFVMHFPIDDRGSVKQVVDTHVMNIEADLIKLAKKVSKATAVEESIDDEWNTDGVWNYEERTDDELIMALYDADFLASYKTVASKRALAIETGIPEAVVAKMKSAELTQLLLGKHPILREVFDVSDGK